MARLLVLVSTISLVTVCAFAATPASAHSPHPGLNFSISIDGVPGCDTRRGDVECQLPADGTFRVVVSLDELPEDIPSYGGFDLFIKYDGGLVDLLDTSTDEWPDCGFAAKYHGPEDSGSDAPPDVAFFGCAIGVPPAEPSTYVGALASTAFQCADSGTLALVHAVGRSTNLVEEIITSPQGELQTVAHAEGDKTRETITVTCADDPTPTLTPEPAAPVLPSTGQAPHSGNGLISLIAALAGSGVLAAGAAASLRRVTRS